MSQATHQTYRARWILPIESPPISDGMMVTCDGVIQSIGPYREGFTEGTLNELGDVAVLPGLVNAHTHLEFSDLEKPIGEPGMELAEWIREVVAARFSVSNETRLTRMKTGHAEASGSGTGLIADIATPPIHEFFADTISFAEVLGLSDERGNERTSQAEIHTAASSHANALSGISPHAPYSTPLPLIERCVRHAQEHNHPLAMHVTESPAERELLQSGGGPFAESLQSMGLQPEQHFPWSSRDPISDLIRLLAQAPRSLIVHGNDLRTNEIETLAEFEHCSVVYCPRTHAFFGHAPHPVSELVNAGVNVALGTDSRASNPDLNLWGEVQHLLRHRQDIAPETVLRMATANGADALGLSSTHGRLAPSHPRRVLTLPTTASTLDQLWLDFSSSSPEWLPERPAPQS
ncbi:amidohydrolase family protein [Rhodopirellula sp. JC740]|uniref:Amidohydrolase family protein n=1 Tax=Rhodopirellula halodulae TaxID=2894198 RepID=A0ABS8NKQ6_9BACT|nr:amidohydrolase family protein [Rhodopirellula sp. JC740]MCC9644091.1 amidohydrolase family protein [Rhodopirellula sp. JC740]